MASIASLLDISRSGLNAQTTAIRTIGENIANVNTPGYSRRTAELKTTSSSGVQSLQSGSGVEVTRIIRQVDKFLSSQYNQTISDRAGADVRYEYLQRAEQPLGLDNSKGSIGYQLTQFFSSVSDLGADPANISLRTQVIQNGQSLVTSIKDSYNQIANLQREADNRLNDLVGKVNSLSTQIADLNGQIASGETSEQQNLALRDKRDSLIKDLSEITSVNVVEIDSRQVNIVLSNGFALVNGSNTLDLKFEKNPSFLTTAYPPGLDGAALGSIVHDYDATSGQADVDFTAILAAGGGEIAGLLMARGIQSASNTTSFDTVGDLVDVASRIEAISRDLLTRFNEAYYAAGDAGGLDGSTPDVFGLFSFAGASDVDADNVAEESDLDTIAKPNYSSILTFNVTNPQKFAAALDNGASPGDSRNLDNLLNLRTDTSKSFSVGNFSASGSSIEDLYREVVSFTGTSTANAKIAFDGAAAREEQVQGLHSSATQVSLDDEFAKLISFQRAFEGSARMIKVGDQLLQEILGLIR